MLTTKPKLVLEDRLIISNIQSSKFENISRIGGQTLAYDLSISIDVHNELFKINTNDNVKFAIYLSSGKAATNDKNDELSKIIDYWSYVMYGKIFKDVDVSSTKRTVYISFGGLLCEIEGNKTIVSSLLCNERVYLMLNNYSETSVDIMDEQL